MRIETSWIKTLTLLCVGSLVNFGCDSPENGDLDRLPAKPAVLANWENEPQTELKSNGETCANEREVLILLDSSRLYHPQPKVEIAPDPALDEVFLSGESFSIKCHFPVPPYRMNC